MELLLRFQPSGAAMAIVGKHEITVLMDFFCSMRENHISISSAPATRLKDEKRECDETIKKCKTLSKMAWHGGWMDGWIDVWAANVTFIWQTEF